MQEAKNAFISSTPENPELNQYWYSASTIQRLVEEIAESGGERTAFLSTPSLYFSTVIQGAREACSLFDIDPMWSTDPGFVLYDYNHPERIPLKLHHSFDMVVIDPPFITREVWERYAEAARLLLRTSSDEKGTGGGRIIASTIAENAALLSELMGLKEQAFKPLIPNLVYQYSIYTNYDTERLSKPNAEIPTD